MKNYKLITASSELPVALTGFKDHINFSGDSKDDNLELLLRAATAEAESHTGRQFLPAIYELQLPGFPASGVAEIDKLPVTGVNSVKYFNADGDETTLTSGTDYYVDIVAEPAKVSFVNTYPVKENKAATVIINFGCGYASQSEVPKDIQAAILLSAADLYVNPSDSVRNIPTKSKALLRNYRLFADG